MKKLWMLIALLALVGFTTTVTVAQETATEEETAESSASDPQAESAELVEKAQDAGRAGDMDEALELLEKAIELDKENHRARLMAAMGYFQKGVQMAGSDRQAANKPLRRGIELMREMKSMKDELSDQEMSVYVTAVYNDACCAAVDGDVEEAVKHLQEAIELGYDDLDYIESDADFDEIRDNEQFAKLIEDLEKSTLDDA